MTIEQAKKKLVAIAKAEVGYREGANNYNKYAVGMENYFGWYVQNQPWCDVFVDWCFVQAFGGMTASSMTYQPVGQFSALCSASADFYKSNKAWFASPEVGDQIFFYVNGGINHTGIVERVSGGVVYTIEGNSSDSVASRAYSVGAANIAGYGRPKWSAAADETDEKEPQEDGTPAQVIDHTGGDKENSTSVSVTVQLPVVRYGAESVYVKVMQILLIDNGCSCGWMGADGEYGDKTRTALVKYQKAHGLAADGICGKDTWQSLLGVK